MSSRATKEARQTGPAGEPRYANPDGSPKRNVAGPADSATRRRAIKDRMAEKEPVRPVPTPQPEANPTADLSANGAYRRIGARKRKLDDEIDRQSN